MEVILPKRTWEISIHFFFKDKFLKNYRKREIRDIKLSLTCCFIAQMATTTWAEPGSCIWLLPDLPCGWQRPKHLGSSSAAFPRPLAGNQMGSGTVQTKISAQRGRHDRRRQFYLLCWCWSMAFCFHFFMNFFF